MTPVLLILAQRSNNRSLQDLFQNLQSSMRPNAVGPPAVMMVLGCAGVAVGLLLLLAFLRSRRRAGVNDSGAGRPARLFNKALKSLGVGLPDRILMRVIARRARLRQPTVLLLNPILLERAATPWVNSFRLSPLREHIRARVRLVAAKAFG